MSKLNAHTYHAQSRLATYVRDGVLLDIPGANSEALPHYRRLVFNVIKDALHTAYPLTVKALGTTAFNELCHRFFKNHACINPQVWRMPGELVTYCKKSEKVLLEAHPYLFDLLEFEWMELDLYTMEDQPNPPLYSSEIRLEKFPVIHRECQLKSTTYPVHLTPPNALHQATPGHYFILGWRDLESKKVLFEDVSAFLAALMERMMAMQEPIEQSIALISDAFGFQVDNSFLDQIQNWLLHLQQNGVLLGTK